MNQFPLSIAQITDLHLFADEHQELLGLRTTKSFQAIIERLLCLQPQLDLLLLTGDLSQDGRLESYERLQHLLTPLNIPTYWIPGNHDNLSAMQQILNQTPIYSQKGFVRGGWQFVLVNSAVPGCVHGQLSDITLCWLDWRLTQIDYPTVVALHHPPFPVNSDWLDSSALENSEQLFAILDRHKQVKLVLFGHIHQEFQHQRNGVDYLGSPSTSIQFEPKSASFALKPEQPGFRLLQLYPDGSWKTKIERVQCVSLLNLAATGY